MTAGESAGLAGLRDCPLLAYLACAEAFAAVTRESPILGSLLDPPRAARAYFARVYWRDPPGVHDYLAGEFRRYVRCRAAHEGQPAACLLAFLGEGVGS